MLSYSKALKKSALKCLTAFMVVFESSERSNMDEFKTKMDKAFGLVEAAEEALDWVVFVDRDGNIHSGRGEEIRQIIADGSWR